MELYLREDFQKAWQGTDPYQILSATEGEVYRELEARRTYRFEFNNKDFFAKVHRGVGWKEIIDNLVRLRAPVLGAYNEWWALHKLRSLGIDTMKPVAFGKKGRNPARQQSFLVTEALEKMSSLEDICEQWKSAPPDYVFKKTIVEKLASITRTLHDNGVNHRDYYLCHFLLPDSTVEQFAKGTRKNNSIRLYLIDLHRAQIRDELPERWRLKDLSGLYFSAMDYGFSQRDIYRFIRGYTGLPLKKALQYHQMLWQKIDKKAQKLYQRMKRKTEGSNY